MRRKLLLMLLFFCQVAAFSQEMALNNKKMKPTVPAFGDTAVKHPISLQIHLGSQGAGADVRYGIGNALSLRLGASAVLPVKIDGAFKISGFNSRNNLEADLANVHLLADYVPFKNARGLRLVGGAGYLFKGNGKLNITPVGSYKYGDIPLTAEQLGIVDVDVSWRGIAPYVGMGFFKSFPKRSFNINFDFGTYYLTAPKATVVGTGMLSANDSQAELISSNVSDYRWLPVLQMNFNFKIK